MLYLLVLSFIVLLGKQWILLSACRRDSAVIKEEIKSFLANRRISQAVVAQVTGEYQLHLSSIQQGPLNRHPKESAQQRASNPADITDLTPTPLLPQGSVRVGSPTGSCSRDRTSASRRNEPSSVGTSWRRPTLVTPALHRQAYTSCMTSHSSGCEKKQLKNERDNVFFNNQSAALNAFLEFLKG